MRILFDTNILLDALLAREPFVADAAFLLEAIVTRDVDGFIGSPIPVFSPKDMRNRLMSQNY